MFTFVVEFSKSCTSGLCVCFFCCCCLFVCLFVCCLFSALESTKKNWENLNPNFLCENFCNISQIKLLFKNRYDSLFGSSTFKQIKLYGRRSYWPLCNYDM